MLGRPDFQQKTDSNQTLNILASKFQTVGLVIVWEPDATKLSEIRTSQDFGISLYCKMQVNESELNLNYIKSGIRIPIIP